MLETVFKKITAITFGVILAFLTVGIVIGTLKLFLNFFDILQTTTITGSYQKMISDVLSLFILIELSRSLVSYFECAEIQVLAIFDAALVFVLREILIALFEHKVTELMLLTMTALLLAIGLLRILWKAKESGQNSKPGKLPGTP